MEEDIKIGKEMKELGLSFTVILLLPLILPSICIGFIVFFIKISFVAGYDLADELSEEKK